MYLKRESNLTEKSCQHYRQGSVQVLHQQVFPDLGPPPCINRTNRTKVLGFSASLLAGRTEKEPPTPLTCFKLSKYAFYYHKKYIFLDVGAVFKEIRA